MAKKLYDFVCGECSEEFEKLVESTNKVECPNCGSTNTHVKFNTPAVKVNGGYDTNNSGTTYIYAAFAENPFKYSLAR